jgi:hypothetical protein
MTANQEFRNWICYIGGDDDLAIVEFQGVDSIAELLELLCSIDSVNGTFWHRSFDDGSCRNLIVVDLDYIKFPGLSDTFREITERLDEQQRSQHLTPHDTRVVSYGRCIGIRPATAKEVEELFLDELRYRPSISTVR